jgi:hypothetical protein
MVFYHNTFVISQLPDIGACECPECIGMIKNYLKNFNNLDNSYKYLYIDYKKTKYLIDNSGKITITKEENSSN